MWLQKEQSTWKRPLRSQWSRYSVCSQQSREAASDLQAAIGLNVTLEAEVLWCLNTAVKHHLYASIEGVSLLFQKISPDSDIAKSFTCGKDKTSYILEFGRASHFKDKFKVKRSKEELHTRTNASN